MEYDPKLAAVADTFVTPFYLDMLHGNILRRSAAEQLVFRRELHAAAELLDQETAARFLDFPEWRGRLAVSWMVGLRGWDGFVPQMGDLLLRSELVYAGQGFAVGLALVGSAEATNQLHAYLDRWLPEVDCFYDQHWAMSALREIDREQGSSHADRHSEQWETWASHDGRVPAVAPLLEVVDLLSRQPIQHEQADGAKVRVVSAAAGEILDRLDDLYDQRPDALPRLLGAIDAHMPVISGVPLGEAAETARFRLVDLQASSMDVVTLNREALGVTDELRQLCASLWGEDYAHLAVEHQRIDELKRLLDAGWDVDDPTDDGMTLLHHAIDIEVDAAAQTGEPLTADLSRLLVARGADLGHRWHGQTPLEAANERGHHLAVKVIEAVGSSGDSEADTYRSVGHPWWAFWRKTDKRE